MNDALLNLDEIHGLCLDMLKFVDDICNKEGLTYWLSGGTLLGAVRHRGFIPWDDDVDLMMPRPDYRRFLEIAPRYANDRYAIVDPWSRRDYAAPWARVWDLSTRVMISDKVKFANENLFLDIFPIDALPANDLACSVHFKRVRLRDILLKSSRKKDLWDYERLHALKRVMMAATSLFPSNTYARWLDRFCARGDFNKARYAGVCEVTHYGSRERMPAEVFRDTVKVTFCDGEYPAPVGWDTYLSRLYGDYMQLPPEDKRASRHRLRVMRVDPNHDASTEIAT